MSVSDGRPVSWSLTPADASSDGSTVCCYGTRRRRPTRSLSARALSAGAAASKVARSPEDVFAYLDELERHGEWQSNIMSSKRETDGPTRVGSRATDVRRVPGRTQSVTYEITAHDPPRKSAFRGVNGPVRPVGLVTVEPVGEGGSRVTIELDFQGHGLVGAIFAPLARRQARTQVAADQRRLKERLESEPRLPAA